MYTFKEISDIIDLIDTNSTQRIECLKLIKNMCIYSYKFKDVWEECFTGIIDSVVECLEDTESDVKE